MRIYGHVVRRVAAKPKSSSEARFPVCTFHIAIEVRNGRASVGSSRRLVTRYWSSEVKVTASIGFPASIRTSELVATAFRIPQSQRLVERSGDHLPPVTAERGRENGLIVADEHDRRRAGGKIPDARCPVLRRGDEPLTGRIKSNRQYQALMSLQGAELAIFVAAEIPELRRSLPAAVAIRRESVPNATDMTCSVVFRSGSGAHVRWLMRRVSSKAAAMRRSLGLAGGLLTSKSRTAPSTAAAMRLSSRLAATEVTFGGRHGSGSASTLMSQSRPRCRRRRRRPRAHPGSRPPRRGCR